MSNKNFVVLGIPRSGTKFFCNTLSQISKIWIPPFRSFEPFNLKQISYSSQFFQSHLYDHDAIVKKMIDMKHHQNKEYMGFKTFLIWHRDFKNIIENNQLDVFIVLRKNFWKTFGSFLLAIENSNYDGSSTRFEAFTFRRSNREDRRIIDYFNNFSFQYWQLENEYSFHKNFIHKVYLEDLSDSVRYSKINDYFDHDIIFNSGYNDSHDMSKYFTNFEELKEFISQYCKSARLHYSALPDYIVQQLDL
jgi:hypothetical protein